MAPKANAVQPTWGPCLVEAMDRVPRPAIFRNGAKRDSSRRCGRAALRFTMSRRGLGGAGRPWTAPRLIAGPYIVDRYKVAHSRHLIGTRDQTSWSRS